MDSFSISQIAQYSGIKPHTIRMWEKRYNALKPNRTEGNTRYYSNSQLRRLLNIASLKNADHKVSELCAMSDEELFELVKKKQKSVADDEADEFFISQFIAAGMNYDELHFEKIFSHCLLRFGLKEAYTRVIYPMMVRVGIMWTSDSLPPVHEHFISNLLKQKLLTAIDALSPADSTSDKWLLFLPENELHDLGLLFANYLIRSSGKKVVYLGANIPMQSLKIAVKDTDPDHLLFFLVHYDLPENTDQYLDQLRSSFPAKNIYLTGSDKLISQLKTGDKIQWVKSVDHLEELLKV